MTTDGRLWAKVTATEWRARVFGTEYQGVCASVDDGRAQVMAIVAEVGRFGRDVEAHALACVLSITPSGMGGGGGEEM